MARLLTTGAEWNDATAEGVTGGAGLSISTANPRTGTYNYRCTSGSNGWTFPFTGVLGTTYYGRAAYALNALPTVGTLGPLGFLFSGGNVTVRIYSDGSVDLVAAGVVIGTSAPGVVAAGTYYSYELAVTIGTGAVDAVELRIDGATIISASALSITDSPLTTFRWAIGVTTGVTSADADDVALNDSTGAAQNTWPGNGKIVLLKPVSDNAKGTGWTNDAAATTNLFDAVDNTPPVGIADTTASTGLHQLRNATSNANSNYDANLQTYTAAGIGATDTINVLVPMAATAAPVTTSSKQGTLGVVSNPTIANVALGAGGTAGAFWSGVAAGTYPTGWKWSFGTTTYAPSVTPGTAPVGRITQVTSSTRIAMVCALGMYVDYTPAETATPPRPTVILQAVNRASRW